MKWLAFFLFVSIVAAAQAAPPYQWNLVRLSDNSNHTAPEVTVLLGAVGPDGLCLRDSHGCIQAEIVYREKQALDVQGTFRVEDAHGVYPLARYTWPATFTPTETPTEIPTPTITHTPTLTPTYPTSTPTVDLNTVIKAMAAKIEALEAKPK